MEIYHKWNMQTKVADTIFELRYPNAKVLDGFEISDHHYRALWLSEDRIDAVVKAYSKLGFALYDCSPEKDKLGTAIPHEVCTRSMFISKICRAPGKGLKCENNSFHSRSPL